MEVYLYVWYLHAYMHTPVAMVRPPEGLQGRKRKAGMS